MPTCWFCRELLIDNDRWWLPLGTRCGWCDEPILAGHKLALVDDEWVHHWHTEDGGRW